jgi:hypothetical protein
LTIGAEIVLRGVYCGTEDVAGEPTGSEIALQVRTAVEAVDPDLAASLAFDTEAGGTTVEAANDDDLRRVFAIAVDAGVVLPSFLGELHEDDIDDVRNDGESADDLGGVWVAPMTDRGLSATGVIGEISTLSYAPADLPAEDAASLALWVRSKLESHGWAEDVGVRVDGDAVLIDAPGVEALERVATAIGVEVAGSVRYALERAVNGDGKDELRWVPEQEESSPWRWIARGPVGDVAVIADSNGLDDAAETVRAHLRARDATQSQQVDVWEDEPGRLAIAGADGEFLWWAVTELGLPAYG